MRSMPPKGSSDATSLSRRSPASAAFAVRSLVACRGARGVSACAGLRARFPLAAVAVVATSGCAPLPDVHPRFAELRPTSVYLLDTANRTTRALERVEFGGLAQRLTGLREFDFPALVGRGLHDELVARGYIVTPQAGGEVPSFAAASGALPASPRLHDAYLESSIVAWSGSTQPPYRMDMTYRLRLVDVASGESLYGGEFAIRVDADKRTPADTSFLRAAIERSVRRSLRLLPLGSGGR